MTRRTKCSSAKRENLNHPTFLCYLSSHSFTLQEDHSNTHAQLKYTFDHYEILNSRFVLEHSYEMGVGDRVLITKAESSHLGSMAIVLALHHDSFRVAVRMQNNEEKWYHPSEVVLDEHMRRLNDKVEKNLREEMRMYRRMSLNPREVSKTAARVAIEAAIHARVVAERPNAKLISTTLSDAIAFQLFNYRRDRNHTLVFVSMTFQFLVRGVHRMTH